MKKLTLLLLFTGLTLFTLKGQNIPAGDNALLENYINSRFSISKEQIKSDTLKKLTIGNVYLVKATFKDASNQGVLWEGRLAIKDGKLLEPEDLSTEKKLVVLTSLLRKDFILKSESDAKMFERVVDIFYPLGWSNEKYRAHLKKDGKWYFVRGEFFESREAVIVTLDAAQRITDVSFSLEALKK
jgi:hypothetical protein